MKTYSFEKLHVWQNAKQLQILIYKTTKAFPSDEKYGLTSQIRRSASSITTNLAEGSGRASNIDKAHFTNISYSSGLETIDHLVSAYNLEYISETEYKKLRELMDEVIRQLNSLYKYQLKTEQSLKKKLKA